MSYAQRPESGVLFRNDKKTKDNQPDYQGEALIDGKLWKMSAWLKDGKKGKFMSFSFQPPYKGEGKATKTPQAQDDDTADIPF